MAHIIIQGGVISGMAMKARNPQTCNWPAHKGSPCPVKSKHTHLAKSTTTHVTTTTVTVITRLSRDGKLDAIRHGRKGISIQVRLLDLPVNSPDLELFDFAKNGYLVGATCAGVTFNAENVPRIRGLSSDIELDFFPESGYDILEEVKARIKDEINKAERTITTVESFIK